MASDWDSACNLLCVRLDAIGDLLMTTPAIRALREGRKRRITLLTSPAAAAMARLIPEIDGVIAYAPPWMKATPQDRPPDEDLAMAERLRAGHFDGAVIFTVRTQSPLPAALLCYLADVPRVLAHCRENPYQLIPDWVPESELLDANRHEVERQLALVQHIGCTIADDRLSLHVPEGLNQRIGRRVDELGIDTLRPWVVVHPGASAPSRRYPTEHFIAVVRQLTAMQWQVVLTGSVEETDLVEAIRQGAGGQAHSLAGQLDVAELAALIALAPLLIVNNTGPAHMAAAVRTPVVVLYALTNLQHMPWKVPSRVLFHDVPCRNCYKSICPQGHHHCLQLLEPERVVNAARELMAPHFPRPLRDAAN